MKYKVGDKVRIKSFEWYESNKDKGGYIPVRYTFVDSMARYCGQIATVTRVIADYYRINLDGGNFKWVDEVFDENFKEEDMETKKIVLPDGWEIDKVENGEIILKESKKELPKTWEECIKILGKGEYINSNSTISECDILRSIKEDANIVPAGLGKPLLALCQLLVCREVHRQGWKPDYKEVAASIEYIGGEINKSQTLSVNAVLSFQTEEVRDQFLENFSDLIEEAKELI